MIYVRKMPDGSEAVEFVSLSVRIREFVNSVRDRVPESDHNDQIGQVPLVDQNVPEDPEVRESFEAERRNGNQIECENENSADNENQNLLNSSLPEQNVPEETAVPETSEQQRKRKGKMVVYEDSENSERIRKGKMVAYEDSESSENTAANEIQNQLALYEPERHTPEDTENVKAPGTSGEENQPNGNEVAVYENPEELTVYKGNHTPAEVDAVPDSDDDTSRTISDLPTEFRNICRRSQVNVNKAAKNKKNPKKTSKFCKNQPYRTLSDLLTQLADEKVEIPFPHPLVDDIPQMSSRKRKAEKAKCKDNKKKKHKAQKTKESPRLDEAGPSNRGTVNRIGCTEPCGSESVVVRASRAKPSNPRPANRKESREPCGSGSMVDRVRKAKPTNHGQAERNRSSVPSGSRFAVGRPRRAKPLTRGYKPSKPTEINDPRVEEVGEILRTFNEEVIKERGCIGVGDCDGCEPSGSQSVVVRDTEVNGLHDEMQMQMETEMVQAREPETENLVCTLNQNPAELSPEEAEKFMRES